MALIITDNQHYSNIASAIRTKLSTNETFAPAEMASAIMSISGGGEVTQDQDGYIVLPSDGGGGGGSSDFSTADVTVIISNENVEWISMAVTENNEDYGEISLGEIFNSGTYSVVLYKGKALGAIHSSVPPFQLNVSTTGDIECDGSDISVSGDGTITIS